MKFLLYGALAFFLFFTSIETRALVIYSQRSSDLIADFIDRFSAETGIETQVLYVSDGLFSRILAEGTTSADVVLTSDLLVLLDLKSAGLSRPLSSSVTEAVIDEDFRDDAGYWFGLTGRARIVYAAKKLAEGQPGTLEGMTIESLADESLRGRICVRSGLHPYNVTLFSAYAYHHGIEALSDFLKGLKANLARRPQGNDRAQAKAVWQGVCDIALGNSYYLGLMQQDEEQQKWFNAIVPQFVGFEDGGVHFNVSGFAVLRSADNVDEARALLEFLLSEDIQKQYAEKNFEYPIREDVEVSDIVKDFSGGVAFERDVLDLDEIRLLRPKVIEVISKLGFDD